MKEFFLNSVYFGLFITLATYFLGFVIHKKTNFFLFTPLLVSITSCICILYFSGISFDHYMKSANFIGRMLTPATICLAVPLYQQFEKLKENWLPILGGILSGVLCNLTFIYIACLLLKIGHVEYVSMLPKSITTAIGLALAQEFHGIVPITVMLIIITGNIGNLFAPQLCRLFHIHEPVAVGVAIGTSSHALGTSRAIEIGDVEGAMSGLSIAVTGLLTVAIAPFFAALI